MLLLIRKLHPDPDRDFFVLHSTMLLLIPFSFQNGYLLNSILHSTMLLLILRSMALRLENGHFYIPLCFYLYSVHFDFIIAVFIFYIPLCFYLYYFPHDRAEPGDFFYIPLCFYLYVVDKNINTGRRIFTFHYASTYTVTRRSAVTRGSILHSTMLLLIR